MKKLLADRQWVLASALFLAVRDCPALYTKLGKDWFIMGLNAAFNAKNYALAAGLYDTFKQCGYPIGDRVIGFVIGLPHLPLDEVLQLYSQCKKFGEDDHCAMLRAITREPVKGRRALDLVLNRLKSETRKKMNLALWLELFKATHATRGIDEAVNILTSFIESWPDDLGQSDALQFVMETCAEERLSNGADAFARHCRTRKLALQNLFPLLKIYALNGDHHNALLMIKSLAFNSDARATEAIDLMITHSKDRAQVVRLLRLCYEQFQLVASTKVLADLVLQCSCVEDAQLFVDLAFFSGIDALFLDSYVSLCLKEGDPLKRNSCIFSTLETFLVNDGGVPFDNTFERIFDCCSTIEDALQVKDCLIRASSADLPRSQLSSAMMNVFLRVTDDKAVILEAFSGLVEAGAIPSLSTIKRLLGIIPAAQLSVYAPNVSRALKNQATSPRQGLMTTLWGLASSRKPDKAQALLDHIELQ
eukprot:TRINITY_DN18254_c0_g1_i1.p1 TRINITY_DN18254_c0_g1~~TRINITY_DN18254_c0_g1_i1.p1  ORF type:complete len:547 (-),score=117.89 TRINITY_DN18254_c0_g1_i1:26-1453(-)